MKKALLAVAVVSAAVQAWAIKGTLRTDTETLTGEIKWQPRQRQYEITIIRDKRPIAMERKLADVVGLDIPTPPNFDKAVAQVESGNGAAVLKRLMKGLAVGDLAAGADPGGMGVHIDQHMIVS
ncbi:MAG: hypothetical protein IJ983_03275, partial [Kiritimatiellae bacterium]|nr:hypothetical protein [Kiritimatiellia bacterium]